MRFATRVHVIVLLGLSCLSFDALGTEPGFYFGASVGRADQSFDPSDGIVVGFPSGGIVSLEPDGVSTDSGKFGWAAVVGYRITRYFAAEVSYLDFGETSVSERYDLGPVSPILVDSITREFKSEIRGPAFSVLAGAPVGEHWFPYLRVGVLFADQKIDLGQFAIPSSMKFGDEVFLGGLGADWQFAERWKVRAEYMRSADLDGNTVSGKSHVEMWSLGVLFQL